MREKGVIPALRFLWIAWLCRHIDGQISAMQIMPFIIYMTPFYNQGVTKTLDLSMGENFSSLFTSSWRRNWHPEKKFLTNSLMLQGSFPVKLQRGCGVSLPADIKSHLDMVLGNWLYVAWLEQGVGPDVLQQSLPASTVLWFCEDIFGPYCSWYINLLRTKVL